MSVLETPLSKSVSTLPYISGPMMSELPRVSVVVIAKDEERTIARCISSVLKQDYPNFEVIFVDSHSADRTSEIVKAMVSPDISVVFADSEGNAAAARNQGIRLARGKTIAFVDGDCYLDEHWLRRAINYLQNAKDPRVVAVGGPFIQVPPVENTTTRAISDVESTKLGRGGSTRSRKEGGGKFTRSLSLSGAVFYADAIKKVGFFDEGLRYCEDSDFCQRIRSAGYKLLSFGDMGAFHTPKYSSLREFAAKMWNYGIGRGNAIRHDRKLATTSGLAALVYLITFAATALIGVGIGLYEARILAIILGCLYVGLIAAFSVVISLRQRSIRSFFVAFAAFVALHIPYSAGLIQGMVFPTEARRDTETRSRR